MALPPGIAQWKIDRFENAHLNFVQPLDKDQSFDLHLKDPGWRGLSQLEQYNLCTRNLQWIIKTAIDRRLSVRAMGSGWSLSKCAVSEDALINTKRYRHKFRLSDENFNQSFLDKGNRAEDHLFLQCGNTIIEINEYLETKLNKSLRVSGGSNGQTVVGAFSTNTHGAAFDYGALPEMIKGIHVVTDPHIHFYVERKGEQVTSPAFHGKIGATYIADDDLFNALLVSFGSFGIIHGVLVEVEDKFLLEQKLRKVSFDDDMTKAITEGDFSGIEDHLKYKLSDKDHPLYHFELALNPHDFKFNSVKSGLYLRVMHKVPYRDDYVRINRPTSGHTYGDDTLGLIQSVLDAIEAAAGFLNRLLIPKMVNLLFDTAYDRPEDAVGTIGETFNNTIFRGQLFSAAFAMDRKDVVEAIKLCLEINKKTKLAGVLALRFVKGTKATLGFTKWSNTVVLEIDGADARVNYKYCKKLAEALEDAKIRYTLHWGKINKVLNETRVRKMYGTARLKKWKEQRSRIMSQEAQAIFNNQFLEKCGLDEYVEWEGPKVIA